MWRKHGKAFRGLSSTCHLHHLTFYKNLDFRIGRDIREYPVQPSGFGLAWCDHYHYLKSETSEVPGRWIPTLPQRGSGRGKSMAHSFCFPVLFPAFLLAPHEFEFGWRSFCYISNCYLIVFTFKMRPATSNLIKVNTPDYNIPSKALFSWLTFLNCPSNFTCENLIIALASSPS